MYRIIFTRLLIVTLVCGVTTFARAEQAPITQNENGMNNARLGEIIHKLDPDAQGRPGFWRFNIDDAQVLVISDDRADRMRILQPVAEIPAEQLEHALLYRLLQANFDTALDARYAAANDVLWSVFIHPLSPLTERQFLSGVAQTISLVKTFGSTYTSGALSFGGGDSNDEIRKLHEQLLEHEDLL